MMERTFSIEDQREFARLSGDRNPLHLDAEWASGVFPGAVVVHGVHALLWALEAVDAGPRLRSLTVSFLKPILLDEKVRASLTENGVTVTIRGQPVVVARFDTPADADGTATPKEPGPSSGRWAPSRGSVPPPGDAVCAKFPRLTAALGADAVQGLAAVSTLVGMHCPGLHSMLSGFSVVFSGDSGPLCYHVEEFSERFGRVTLRVSGQGLSGTVDAFSTEPAVSASDTSPDVIDASFAGQQPLIIGGSSGLGASTARLLARGGAAPVITYLRSGDAATRLVGELQVSGASCAAVRLDVQSPESGFRALRDLPWRGSEVYYFASSRIFRRRLELYQAQDMLEFLRVYVDGFYECIRGLVELRDGQPLTVFYPSTVAIDRPPRDLLEYAFAKRIGELLCERLSSEFRNLRILTERLPRVATRQTRSIIKVSARSPEEVMMPILRRVQGGV